MSLTAYEGPAGCGKTHSVMEALTATLATAPLQPDQRVLALTFMHGARHRLDDQLARTKGIGSKFDAVTLDSFAWNLARRWRARLREYGLSIPTATDYAATIERAARLVQDQDVKKWIAAVYPVVVVDEAQDLELPRLSLIDGLISECKVLLAFDAFQCLKLENRPVAVEPWIKGKCTPHSLTANRRTNKDELILAASQVRSGEPLTASGPSFKIESAPKINFAASKVAYRMLGDGTFALITPSLKSTYAKAIPGVVSTKQFGKIGPYPIAWEGDYDGRGKDAVEVVDLGRSYSIEDLETCWAPIKELPVVTLAIGTLKLMRSAKGLSSFPGAAVQEILERHLSSMRQFARQRGTQRNHALTIHQAKNREFDRVVVLWSYSVPEDADQRRRLLYNAITRAKKSCVVIVPSEKQLKEAPFA